MTDGKKAETRMANKIVEKWAELGTRDVIDEIRDCLVVWRCVNCNHKLILMPANPFGACPRCGTESPSHGVYSVDTEKLTKIFESISY